MTDICERLVRFDGKTCISTDTEVEAADTIEALREKNARLRKALTPFAELVHHTGSMSDSDGVCVYVEDLRAAAAAMSDDAGSAVG